MKFAAAAALRRIEASRGEGAGAVGTAAASVAGAGAAGAGVAVKAAETGQDKQGDEDTGAVKTTDTALKTVPGIKLEMEEEEEEEKAGEEESQEELEAKFGCKPDNYIHPASLVFAIFGKPIDEDQDKDLSLKMTGGITGSKRKEVEVDPASPASGGESASRMSTKQLQLMNGAGGKSSRAEVKKFKHEVNSENKKLKAADADTDLRRRAFEVILAPPLESESAKELSASVKTPTEAVVSKERLDQEEAARKRWHEEVGAKERKLAFLEKRKKGDSEEAKDLEDELMKLCANPVIAPLAVAASSVVAPTSETSNLAGGDGGGTAAGEVGEKEGPGDAEDEVEIERGRAGSGAGGGGGGSEVVEVESGESAGVAGGGVDDVIDIGVCKRPLSGGH